MFRKGVAAVAIAAAIATAGIVAGCGSSSSGGSSGSSGSSGSTGGGGTTATASKHSPYTIDFIGGFSGVLQPFAEAQLDAMQSAADVINAAGGADGHKLVITHADDAGDPTTAATVAQTVSEGSNPPNAVVPGESSGDNLPQVPVFQRAGILMMNVSESAQSNNPKLYPLSFGVDPLATEIEGAVAAHLQQIGVKSVAFIGGDDETGTESLAALTQALKAKGIKVVGSQLLPLTAVSATAALGKLQATGAQELVASALSGPVAGVVFKARTQLGWNVPTVADVDTTANPLWEQVGAKNLQGVNLMAGTYYVQNTPVEALPGFKAFVAELNKIAPKREFPLEDYAAGWLAVTMVAGGIDAAHSTNPQQMAQALESVTASQVPNWFATSEIGISATNHFVTYQPGDFTYPKAAPRDSDGAVAASGS